MTNSCPPRRSSVLPADDSRPLRKGSVVLREGQPQRPALRRPYSPIEDVIVHTRHARQSPTGRHAGRVEEKSALGRALPTAIDGDVGDRDGPPPAFGIIARLGHRVAAHERELPPLINTPEERRVGKKGVR